MKILGKKWRFCLTILCIAIISGCAGFSPRVISGYELISPYRTVTVTKGASGPLIGIMTENGIVQEINIEDWRLKVYGAKEIPPDGTIIESRGQLLGLVANGGMWIALQGEEIYTLTFSSDCQYKFPPEDIKGDGSLLLHNDEYFVKGYRGIMISSHRGNIPILLVNYFERTK